MLAQTGGVEGTVKDKKSGKVIAGATIQVESEKGGVKKARSSATGAYRLQLREGVYRLRAYQDGYYGLRLARVPIPAGPFRRDHLELEPLTPQTRKEVVEVVYVPDASSDLAQVNLRLQDKDIGDRRGRQAISRSGDSDAASATRRVVGVSVQDASLVVRGLSGRYSAVLLNGLPVPSTEPDRPGVSLDLFPTALVQSLNIIKSPSPQVPANWAGGVLDISTLAFPDGPTLNIGVSGSLNTMTSFQPRLSYNGGSFDALGFDDGTRTLPSDFPQDQLIATRTGTFSSESQYEKHVRSLPNRWNYHRTTSMPSFGVGASFGNLHKFCDDVELGYLVCAWLRS